MEEIQDFRKRIELTSEDIHILDRFTGLDFNNTTFIEMSLEQVEHIVDKLGDIIADKCFLKDDSASEVLGIKIEHVIDQLYKPFQNAPSA
jgi:hypothetical protein